MPKLATHQNKMNQLKMWFFKCKDEALQVLNHECEDPWNQAHNFERISLLELLGQVLTKFSKLAHLG
jgi:hypothetical protein